MTEPQVRQEQEKPALEIHQNNLQTMSGKRNFDAAILASAARQGTGPGDAPAMVGEQEGD